MLHPCALINHEVTTLGRDKPHYPNRFDFKLFKKKKKAFSWIYKLVNTQLLHDKNIRCTQNTCIPMVGADGLSRVCDTADGGGQFWGNSGVTGCTTPRLVKPRPRGTRRLVRMGSRLCTYKTGKLLRLITICQIFFFSVHIAMHTYFHNFI